MGAPSKKVFARRLLYLAAFLERLHKRKPHRFEYGAWVGSDWKGRGDLSCGTTACAFGWAAALPKFRAEGLKLKARLDGFNYKQPNFFVGRRRYGANGAAAAARFFGPDSSCCFIWNRAYCNIATGVYLVSPPKYASAHEVAHFIRQFVEAKYKVSA